MNLIKKSILASGLSLTVAGSLAHGDVLCEQDSRPADGPYQKILLKFDSPGNVDVYYSYIRGGFGPGGSGDHQATDELIAQGLECQFTRHPLLGLKCYASAQGAEVLEFAPRHASGQEFVEVKFNGELLALFDAASCNNGRDFYNEHLSLKRRLED